MDNYPLNELNEIRANNTQCNYMPKLAHAYVPFQCMKDIYPPMVGLTQGTIFPELDMPYGEDPEYMIDE
jgi:hypothetical protein